MEQVLEIKCDLSVTGDMDKPNKIEYLTVIVSTLKNPKGTQNEVLVGTALVEAKRKSEITERFEAVMGYIPSKKTTIVSFIIATLFLSMSRYLFYVDGKLDNELKEETAKIFIEYGYKLIEE